MNREERLKAAVKAADREQIGFNTSERGAFLHGFEAGAEAEAESKKAIPFQCCPICQGSGKILAPQCTSAIYNTCDVCNGAKIISMHTHYLTNNNDNLIRWKIRLYFIYALIWVVIVCFINFQMNMRL